MTMPAEPLDLDRRYTEEEYLAITETCEGKYDLVDGRMIDVRAMAGGTEAHALIMANCIGEIRQALKGGPCRVYASDMRVKNARKPRYRYPDLSVVCGVSQFAENDPKRYNLLNPVLTLEVLSETSDTVDRGQKFWEYREIEAFREYVLVSQDQPMVENYYRQADSTWLLSTVRGIDATVHLRSIGVKLQLADLYAGVTLPPAADED